MTAPFCQRVCSDKRMPLIAIPQQTKGPQNCSSGFPVFVERGYFLGCEGGREDGEFIEASVEVSDGEFGLVFGGESPVADLSVTDGEGAELFFFGRLFPAD